MQVTSPLAVRLGRRAPHTGQKSTSGENVLLVDIIRTMHKDSTSEIMISSRGVNVQGSINKYQNRTVSCFRSTNRKDIITTWLSLYA